MITDYDSLIDSFQKSFYRNDLYELIPQFIQFAEIEMYSNPVEVLEIQPKERVTTALTTIGSRFLELPPGFVEARDFRINYDGFEYIVNQIAPRAMRIRQGEGVPAYFSVTNQIEFDVAAGQEYSVTMTYKSNVDPLTEASPINTILTNYPNIYLYGMLYKGFTHAMDDEQALKYQNLFYGAIRGANELSSRIKWSPNPSMSLQGWNP